MLDPAQRFVLALPAILNQRNKDAHDILGGALRPHHSHRATFILASGWDVRTPGEARESLEWLLEGGGHRKIFAADGLGAEAEFAAWDFCRAANVAGWAFVAYLLNRDAAWSAMVRAAKLAHQAFNSFDELGASYLRGLQIWSGDSDEGRSRVASSKAAFDAVRALPESPHSAPWTTSLEGVQPPHVEIATERVRAGESIAAAVEKAGRSGRVVIEAGKYEGSITPPHAIELVGEGEVVIEASDKPAIWARNNISVSLRNITVHAGRGPDGKTLNAIGIPGGMVRLRECKVTASHHGASVRDDGYLLLSRSTIESTGQNSIWCEGGAIAVVESELRAPGVHGVYVGKSSQSNVLEDSRIVSAGQCALFAEARTRARRCELESPGQYGVLVKASLKLLRSTIRGSKGWGAAVQTGGDLQLVESTITGSTGANLDVKEGSADVRGSSVVDGASSGVVLQAQSRAFFLDSKVENNAQGNIYAIADSELVMARASVAGEALGVFSQDAETTIVETKIISKTIALDVRGGKVPVCFASEIRGEIAIRGNGTARFAECKFEGKRTVEDGATFELAERSDVEEQIARAIGGAQGESEDDDDEDTDEEVETAE